MTDADVAAIVEGIAPVTWEAITRATAALVQRQTALETQLAQFLEAAHEQGALRERVAVLETRAPVPGPPGPAGRDGVEDLGVVRELAARLQGTDTQLAGLAGAVTEMGALRERVAVLETRAPVPGPPGPAGRDGVDGVGFEDLQVEHDGERAVTVKGVRGDVVKVLGTFTLPTPIYRGVWTEGRPYEPGDGVTWAGSEWHCQATTTTKPGDGSKAWLLKVKRGRDGKDGKDGQDGPPGPPGKDWQQVFDDTRRR